MNKVMPLPWNTWTGILGKHMRDANFLGITFNPLEPQRGLTPLEMEMISCDAFLKLCLVSVLGEPFREKALSGKTEKLLLCYL